MLSLTVYCNCVETGKALPPPKPDWRIEVYDDEDGMVEAFCADPKDAPLLREWWQKACPHPERQAFRDVDFVNITGAVMMRKEISQQGEYPVLLEKVFQDGVTDHHVVPKDVAALQTEIARLDYDKLSGEAQAVIDKLQKAVTVSLEMQKPISF
jgi:hypothetical protein